MNSAEIRSTYLRFFEERGHTLYPSASLVPEGDPTLLFTGAGMNQFKDMFLGRGHLPFRRATTTQKCLRVPDLDEVGRTPSHHTFFEMLGNFSFGDYFKKEAIAWADELLCQRFGLERDRLLVSVYQEDDEAFEFWRAIGYGRDRIFRYGEDDNFWPASAPSQGPNGPCGPCSEIYYDFGAEFGGGDPASNGRRYVEIWNLVFTQFDRRDGGDLQPLPQQNIDTGMGFERIVRVLQGGDSNFDTDLFRPILTAISERTGRERGESEAVDRAMRRMADHLRASVFCVADGVVPSNERQGYVVRKILRRAIADGMDSLGMEGAFLADLVPAVIAVPGMAETFPELRRHEKKIGEVIAAEERKFLETYERGRQRLAEEIETLRSRGSDTLPGPVAFFLWDTAGFPLDLTQRVLDDEHLKLDEEGFHREMEEQRRKSRAGSNIKGEIFDSGPLAALKQQLGPTEFIGYEQEECRAAVRAILLDAGPSETATEGDAVALLFERTPFYAESGGQVGDRGVFETGDGEVRIHDVVKQEGFHVHHGTVVAGSVRTGEEGTLRVDRRHRHPTMRNHTATHLLHWALRKVLGDQVEQKGSLVDAERLRFDFSYPGPVPPEQLDEVEHLVNDQVLKNLEVSKQETAYDHAIELGALALFGEKYGDQVRVVKVEDERPEDQSVELCGGTHVGRTGDIGLFKVTQESGIAAGIRRIEAVTGLGALRRFQERERLLQTTARELKTSPDELASRVGALRDEVRKLKKELVDAARAGSGGSLDEVLAGAEEVHGIQVFVAHQNVPGAQLMALGDAIKDRQKQPFVAVLIGDEGERIPIITIANKGAQAAGLHAGELCKSVAGALKGGGGGNPALARGQGRDRESIGKALELARAEVRSSLAQSQP